MADPDRLWSAVCKRGHVITDRLQTLNVPGIPKFCRQFGAPVITACESCSAALPGGYTNVIVAGPKAPDAFCFNCGAPHRWTSREQRIGHLQNLLEFEELDDATQLTIIEELTVLAAPVEEVPDERRVGAAERIRRLAPKLWETGLPVLQSVATAAVKAHFGWR
jgi:hypothetical protein